MKKVFTLIAVAALMCACFGKSDKKTNEAEEAAATEEVAAETSACTCEGECACEGECTCEATAEAAATETVEAPAAE